MKRVYYICSKCHHYVSKGEWEFVLGREDRACPKCNYEMRKMRCEVREGDAPNINNRPYSKPLHSDSLAINPEQFAEHREKFPNIEIDGQGRPVFTNAAEHDDYMDKCGVHKFAQKTKHQGEIIAVLGECDEEEKETSEIIESGRVDDNGLD